MDIRLLSANGLQGAAAQALATAREGKFDAIVGALTASTFTTDEIDVVTLRTSEVTAEAYTVPKAGLNVNEIEIAIGRAICVNRDPSYVVAVNSAEPAAVIDNEDLLSYKAPFKFVPGQVFQYVLEGTISATAGEHAVFACPWFVDSYPTDTTDIDSNGNALLRVRASGPNAFTLRTTITVVAASTTTVTYKWASVVTNADVAPGDIEAIYTTTGTSDLIPYDSGDPVVAGGKPYMVFAFYPNSPLGVSEDIDISIANYYILQVAGPSGYVAPL